MANITPTIKALAESNGFYVTNETYVRTYPNGLEQELDSIEISEENTDFLIVYTKDINGDLFLELKPDYVEDLPYHIPTTNILRNVVLYVVEHFKGL